MTQKKGLTPKQKKGCLIWFFAPILVLLVISVIAAMFDTGTTNDEKKEVEKVKDTPLTLDERVKVAVIGAVDKETNMGEKRIINIDAKEELVKITLFADESLNTKLTKTSMLMNTVDVLEAIDKIKEIQNVAIIWQFTLVDTYGNESVEDVMRSFISRDEMDKINYENFNSDNIPDIAYNFYLHPAFNK